MDESPRAVGTDEQRVRALVAELNALVPRVENQVRMTDVDDEVDVVATRAGALRLGVAILRAAVEERDPYGKRTDAEAELHALIDADGDTWIGRVLIERELPALPPPADEELPPGWRLRALAPTLLTLLIFAVMYALAVGLSTLAGWVG